MALLHHFKNNKYKLLQLSSRLKSAENEVLSVTPHSLEQPPQIQDDVSFPPRQKKEMMCRQVEKYLNKVLIRIINIIKL